ncbi:MAG: 2-oxoglutarate and iron-dependent oxygenase domain-containing protein [Pseudomonadota bacterium]
MSSEAGLKELDKEAQMGALGEEIARDIPRIDLSDFSARRDDIADALWAAATDIGFFQITGHGIPRSLIDDAFALSTVFFAQGSEIKESMAMRPGTNAGWEYKSQVRPSTGTADQKESYQITLPRMSGLWPMDPDLLDFTPAMLAFERLNWTVAMRILSCLAEKLGFAPDTFLRGHDPLSPEYQSTLRLLHYLGMEDAQPDDRQWVYQGGIPR